MKKLFISIASLFMLLGTVSGCNKDTNSTSNNSSNISQTFGENKDYNVKVKAISGKLLEEVAVEIYNGSKLVQSVFTDQNGNASFTLPEGNYDVELMNLPLGHYVDKDLKLEKGKYDYTFVPLSKVIVDEEPTKTYQFQDIMYDFTIRTSDGINFNLNEALETHDAVMINFWYTTCGWCLEEFPFMEEAYKEYSDDIEIIAVSNRSTDSNPVINAFKAELELTFPMAYDNIGLTNLFGVANFPTTIFVDRYGIIAYAYEGSVESKEEMSEIFELFIGDDYVPLTSIEEEEEDNTIPNVSMPSSTEIENAINVDGLVCQYGQNEDETNLAFTWPWLVSEDGKSIYNSNAKINSTAANIETNITIEAGKALAFDYLLSTEEDYDILYVIIDGKIIHQLSGVESSWKTCYAYVSEETKSYKLSLLYNKDYDGYAGTDTIHISNMRIIEEEDIDSPTYIYRDCAQGAIYNNKNYSDYNYKSYKEVFFNEEDGYYHVDSTNGPLVLADLLYSTNWSKRATPFLLSSNNLLNINSKDYSKIITEYSNYSANGSNNKTPVTQELYEALDVITKYYGDNTNENEWLELCCYYASYSTNGKEYEDPTKGLAIWNAYEAKLGNENYATFERPILPRGLKFRFEPEITGVYKINSIGNEEALCWIFDENGEIIAEANFYARNFSYENADRYNFVMYYYFEAGKTYYINPSFYDYLYFGTLQFNVEYVGESYELFTLCSPGYYTTTEDEEGNMTNEIISPGIDIVKGEDGYYHELRENGQVGSIIYADFIYSTIFNFSLTELATKSNAFDFRYGEEGEVVDGGEDMTDLAKFYSTMTIKESGDLYGCVPVDEDLKQLLVALMDKYGYDRKVNPGVENQWLKLCYYYQYFGD